VRYRIVKETRQEAVIIRAHSFIATAGVALGLALLGAVPATARAQGFVGVAGGFNFQGPAPAGEQYTRGFAVQASVGRHLRPSLALRFDAFASQFADTRGTVIYNLPCRFPGCGAGTPGFVKPIGVVGVAANGVKTVNPQGTLYVIAGGGAYYLYRHPSAAGAVRVGVSAGAGVSVPMGSRLRSFVEARYHRMLDAPSLPTWLVPVTFGIGY
jgi:hypothetical protein